MNNKENRQLYLERTFIAVCISLVVFSLYTALFGIFPDIIQRGVHLSHAIVLVYLHSAIQGSEGKKTFTQVISLVLGVIACLAIGYQAVFYDEVVSRYGEITDSEMIIASVALILLLDGTRRIIGWSMVVLALVFLTYAFWGNFLYGDLAHRGYDLERVLGQVYLGADGIFGTPLGVSSTFVILIVILGALLEGSGASKVMMDIAVSLTGRARGGPAKAAVVGSSLMGMISGTAVANVLTTGTISIPLMKRGGYRPHVAAGIEAVSSTGGQLMPPIMGAAAFLMADIIETPYSEIATAAIIPAALFYIAVFAAVHLEAVKNDLQPLKESELPSARMAILDKGHVLLAIPAFVGFLIYGFSVMYSALWAIATLFVLSLLRPSTRMDLKALVKVCKSASEAVLPVALATATAGIIIAVVTLTGVGLKFSSLIVTLSGGNLMIALMLTMLASLILGMGLPTAAAYILVATLAAPALVNMGVDILAAHMFVFYSAMLSAITPPVALAAFAAAAISRENPMRIALTAVKYGLVAFIIPYFFVFDTRLLGQGDFSSLIVPIVTAALGTIALASSLQGWLADKANMFIRLVLFSSAMLLIAPEIITDAIGLITIAVVLAYQIRTRNNRKFSNQGSPLDTQNE
jgi:TRAP transporter 4TM/12TM fusion protein